jgi:hypothetical protein
MNIFLLSLFLSLSTYKNTSLKKRIKKHYFIFKLGGKPRVSRGRKEKIVKHFSQRSSSRINTLGFITYYCSVVKGAKFLALKVILFNYTI